LWKFYIEELGDHTEALVVNRRRAVRLIIPTLLYDHLDFKIAIVQFSTTTAVVEREVALSKTTSDYCIPKDWQLRVAPRPTDRIDSKPECGRIKFSE
jgi:hypothetical protein